MLVRLIYASEAKGTTDVAGIKAILEKAQTKNDQNDVTGMLVFNSRYFLQAVEGSPDKINTLYNVLMKDVRHTNLYILGYENISERIYGEWTMGYATLNDANKRIFLKYSSSSSFNPYAMTGDNALKFMNDLNSSKLKATVEEPKKSLLGTMFGK